MRRGHWTSPFLLCRPSRKPTISPRTIKPTGVGTQDNHPRTNPGILDPSLEATELPRLTPDHVHGPHKAFL